MIKINRSNCASSQGKMDSILIKLALVFIVISAITAPYLFMENKTILLWDQIELKPFRYVWLLATAVSDILIVVVALNTMQRKNEVNPRRS